MTEEADGGVSAPSAESSDSASREVPLSVWREIDAIVGYRLKPIELLTICAVPQQMLGRTAGEERTVFAALEAGDYEMVLAMLRWTMTPADDGAPPVVVEI
jgi:hypothetical protein